MTTTHKVQMNDGALLHVKKLGGSLPSKPLIIALHGASGLSTHTEPEATFAFLSSTFRILVYDARGRGSSSKQLPYTQERWVQDVEELRQWTKTEKFILAGGSYGGTVSLSYVITYPTHLLALILRDTWAWGPGLMMHALKTGISSPFVHTDPDRQFRVWTGLSKSDQDFADGVAEIGPLYLPPGVQQHKEPEWGSKGERSELFAKTQNKAFSENMPRYDVREKLRNIKGPTLVVVERYDLITPVEESRVIAEGIEGAKLVVFEESGHHPRNDEHVLLGFGRRLKVDDDEL